MSTPDNANYLKKWLPFAAIVPAIAYASTVIFQLIYYRSFGIDIFLITPRTDPASLFTLIMFALALIIGYLYLSLISWSYQTISLRAVIIEDILFEGSVLLSSGTGFYYANEVISNSKAPSIIFYISLVIPIAAVVFFWVWRMITMRRRMHANNSVTFKDAYIGTRAWGAKPGEPSTEFSKARIGFVALLMALLALLVAGNEFARSRDTFPMLIEASKSPQSTITLIIGKVDEGYVAKEYDQKVNRFKPGWSIISDDNLKFRNVKIKPLSHLKNLN